MREFIAIMVTSGFIGFAVFDLFQANTPADIGISVGFLSFYVFTTIKVILESVSKKGGE